MLIVNSGNTRRTQLRRAVERLREVNANLIGVTLNRLTRKNEAYYYYYYSDEPYFNDEPEHELVSSHPTNGNGHSDGFLNKLVWRREKVLTKDDK
jgi:Mrp family chromosome partitioning ATPase